MKKILLFIYCIVSCYTLSGKNFILISAPGSGKGTFSQFLSQHYGHQQINLGDIFRKEIKRETELGSQVKEFVERGDMVPDTIKCPIIFQHLIGLIKENKQFILDGFPSSQESFDLTYDFLKEHDLLSKVCFVQFVASDETCSERISSRLICSQCSEIYNTDSKKPKIDGVCDRCNSKLTRRSDAQSPVILKRLSDFHATIEPLLIKAKKLNCSVKYINAEWSAEELIGDYHKLATD